MDVLVCGGRHYSDAVFLYGVLDTIHKKRRITQIIEGGARGADRLGRQWAIDHNIDYRTFEAAWDELGKRAGYVRNAHMLKFGEPHLVVAFEGGVGTANMVMQAINANVPVLATWQYQA